MIPMQCCLMSIIALFMYQQLLCIYVMCDKVFNVSMFFCISDCYVSMYVMYPQVLGTNGFVYAIVMYLQGVFFTGPA